MTTKDETLTNQPLADQVETHLRMLEDMHDDNGGEQTQAVGHKAWVEVCLFVVFQTAKNEEMKYGEKQLLLNHKNINATTNNNTSNCSSESCS